MKSYFPHDSNARNSSELTQVRMKHKAAGYGVYFMLLERLRDEENYMSIKDYNMLAFDLREDASLIKSVIEEFGLFVFTEDGKYFYSEGFKKRMEIKDEKSRKLSEAGKKGAAKRWTEEKDSHPIATPYENDGNKSKVKKSKVNNSKENTYARNIILNDGTYLEISDADIARWKSIYQYTDVDYQIKKMIEWCLNNPQKRKTSRGIGRFITNWLSREDEKRKPDIVKPKKVEKDIELSNDERQAILDEIAEQKKQLGGSK